MSRLAGIRTRIRLLPGHNEAEERLSEEFRFHVEMQTEQNIRDGMEPQKARRQALIAFGAVERHKESMRDGRRKMAARSPPGHLVRRAWAGKEPGIHSGGRNHDRSRHRRDYRRIHPRQRPAPPAAGSPVFG